MSNYSITLNFFLPTKVIDALNKVKVTEDFLFDWRKTDFCHCTVKAISRCDEFPGKKILRDWIVEAKRILDEQKPLKVEIKNILTFPTAIVANIESEELTVLHKKLCKVLPSSQPEFDGENYIPHASLGMVDRNIKVISDKKQDFGEFIVKEIQLMVWDKDIDKSVIYHCFNLGESR